MKEKQRCGTEIGDRRAQLRERLLDAAEATIAAHGLAGLKAREIAAEAGCALGAIYNVFEDLDELILRVGSRTLAQLEEALARRRDAKDGPAELIALAAAYLAFARERQPRWRALFEHRLPQGRPLPDWYVEDRERLFGLLEGPLERMAPGLEAQARARLARTLFSAVHGIVSLGLEQKLAATDSETLDEELANFVRLIAAGLGEGR